MTPPGSGRGLATSTRFAAVGVVNTAIDLGLYVVLQAAGVPLLVANTLSTSAGLTFSYFSNRRFTFRVRGRHDPRRAVGFLLVTGTGLWVLQPLVLVACGPLVPLAAASWADALAKVAAIAVGMVWNFTWYRFVVFRGARPLLD